MDLDSYMLFTNISGGISGLQPKEIVKQFSYKVYLLFWNPSDPNLDLGYLGHFEPMHELHVRSD